MTRARVSDRLPDFPWDKLTSYAVRRARASRTASSTSRSARPSTRPRGGPGRAARPRRRARLPADHRPCRPPGRPASTGWPRRHGVTGAGARRRAAGDRFQGADRARCRSTSASAPGDLVVYPELAYPTYEVGAGLAGARAVATDSLTSLGPETPARCSGSTRRPTRPAACCPSSTCGRSSTGAASAACCWSPTSATSSASGRATPVSRAAPRRLRWQPRGAARRALAGKRSNLAGYRCAFVAGDPAVIAELLAVRKNLGLHDARAAAGGDGGRARRRRPRRRRSTRATRRAAACCARRSWPRIPDRPQRGRALPVGHPRRGLLGDRRLRWPSAGILVAPGAFYGRAGERHVRIAFTATDERVAAAAARLAAS